MATSPGDSPSSMSSRVNATLHSGQGSLSMSKESSTVTEPLKKDEPYYASASEVSDVMSQQHEVPVNVNTGQAEQSAENSALSHSKASNAIPNLIEFNGMEIDPDQPESDADLTLVASLSPRSTVSLRNSIYEYIEENGRTYHAYNSSKYIGPNDEVEQERLDLQHHLFVMTMNNQLHLAPVSKNPQNVLDIGTGTGIWAIEFAKQYPSASVIGTDLSPIQPEFVPQNCSFQIDDAEDEWTYSRKFDYIHGRALISCFKEPGHVVSSIYENLTPGGYFELQDPVMPLKSIDGTLKGTALDQWQTSCMAAAEKLGRPWSNSKNFGKYMADAGFVDIEERHYYWATNQWIRGKKQKLQALLLQANLQQGLAAWGLSTLSRGLGWNREKIEVLLEEARNDLKNPQIHAYAECYVVYGRKPE